MPESHPIAKSYGELPEHVRLFLETLDADDTVSLKDGIKLAQSTKAVARFWKWVLIFIFGTFTAMATLGQAVDWLWTRFKGGG